MKINGRTAKSATKVGVGDTIVIRKNQIDYKIQILQIPKNRLGAKLVPLHIKDLTDSEQLKLLKSRKLVQDYYRGKGEGRPTKKDRRDIEEFTNTEDLEEEEDTDWDDFFNGEDKEY